MKRTKYKNEMIGKVKIIEDFLPPPEQLVLKDETIKITLSLTKSSVDYFKKIAKSHHTQYQKMIRALVDLYVKNKSKKAQRRIGSAKGLIKID